MSDFVAVSLFSDMFLMMKFSFSSAEAVSCGGTAGFADCTTCAAACIGGAKPAPGHAPGADATPGTAALGDVPAPGAVGAPLAAARARGTRPAPGHAPLRLPEAGAGAPTKMAALGGGPGGATPAGVLGGTALL
eukprot:1610016-Pyramimonas_sp.AAC.1